MHLLAVTLDFENLFLAGSLLMLAALLINKLGARIGLPVMLLSLAIGVLAGPEVLGLQFDDMELAHTIGHYAMAIILFTAGFETSFKRTKTVLWHGISIATIGLLITAAAAGVFIYYASARAVGGGIWGCLLLAAIMSPTDSASLFSILRNRKARLKGNLDCMLELESAGNDPMASTMTMVMVTILLNFHSGGSMDASLAGSIVILLAKQFVFGLAIGFGIGYASVFVIKHLHLPSGSLYSILILCLGLLASGLAEFLGGNGLLAIYVAAIIMGQMKKVLFKREISGFFEAMTWLVQLIMFLVLGLLARPSQMVSIIWPALLTGAFLIFVARPAGVLLSLMPFRRIPMRVKLFTS